MDQYRKLVKKLADESSSDLIPNGGTEHAEVLIENIFAHANDTVRVFTGELNARVYGSDKIVDKAKEFLQSGAGKKLEIIIQNFTPNDGDFLRQHNLVLMCSSLSGRDLCSIRFAHNDDKTVDSHFVVMDKIGYRFEPDRTKPTAIGCFNDPGKAELFADFFDDMFDRATPLQLDNIADSAVAQAQH